VTLVQPRTTRARTFKVESSKPIFDFQKQPIVFGSKIVVAMRMGSNARLRIGVVEGFSRRGDRETIGVRWTDVDGFGPVAQTTEIDADRLGTIYVLEKPDA
jgi:hypothetical protein